MKIGTLNLNGETWNLNNKKPRLPECLFDINYIKTRLTEKLSIGLLNLLQKEEYDIIAIQELVFIQDIFNDIKKVVEDETKNYYTLVVPNFNEAKKSCKIKRTPHFTVGYIIKTELIHCCEFESLDEFILNRHFICTYKSKKGIPAFKMINLHIPCGNKEQYENLYNLLSKVEAEDIIILGDLNTYQTCQIEGEKPSSVQEHLFEELKNKNFSCSEDGYKNYTYLISNKWRKLDHIYYSKSIDKKYTIIENKVDDVNYYSEIGKKQGFTDHSMLEVEITPK